MNPHTPEFRLGEEVLIPMGWFPDGKEKPFDKGKIVGTTKDGFLRVKNQYGTFTVHIGSVKKLEENRKEASIDKFLKIAVALDGDTIVTPEIFEELVTMAARLEEIERDSHGGI